MCAAWGSIKYALRNAYSPREEAGAVRERRKKEDKKREQQTRHMINVCFHTAAKREFVFHTHSHIHVFAQRKA